MITINLYLIYIYNLNIYTKYINNLYISVNIYLNICTNK